jgi:hypothetical protein
LTRSCPEQVRQAWRTVEFAAVKTAVSNFLQSACRLCFLIAVHR